MTHRGVALSSRGWGGMGCKKCRSTIAELDRLATHQLSMHSTAATILYSQFHYSTLEWTMVHQARSVVQPNVALGHKIVIDFLHLVPLVVRGGVGIFSSTAIL